MEILLIIFLLTIVGIVLFLLFKILKWVFQKKSRMVGVLFLSVSIGAGIIINKLFFVKMEFIQSKVYPDLYIIKNPTEDKNVLQKAIKTIVLEKTKKNLNNSISDVEHSIDFYEYTKGSFFIPFNDAGTYYFIDHEEDPGGFSVEVLDMYSNYRIAEFSLQRCQEDTSSYYGKLKYYKDAKIIKTDTILNSCDKSKK
ncbi:hypothetical protein [Aquimarina rubra]|uniref:Uncharacterized protein n=1 Tax=Aquimarina rubra TaxID=1920033 RepID=A0ABW5LHC9_9FLAO